jgi:Zn-dependent protease with chaperone function
MMDTPRKALASVLVFLAVIFVTRVATAKVDRDERQRRRDAELVEALRAKNPEAADAFARASAAAREKDHQRAIGEYTRVQTLEPSFTPAYRRQAIELVELDRRAEALSLARKAFKMEESFENELTLAVVLLSNPRQRSDSEAREAMKHAESAVSHKPDDVDARAVQCEAALATSNQTQLDVCSKALVRLAPDEAGSHLYASIAALTHGSTSDARASIAEAKRLGADAELTRKIENAIDEQTPIYEKWGLPFLKVIVGWLGGLGLLLLFGAILSSATLRIARNLAPDDRAGTKGAALRKVYRAVLHLSSVYYYVSLPLVLLVCVAIGGGLIYAFFAIGHIPVKLVVIIGCVVLFTIWSVLKSLLVRPKDEDPGTRIELEKHPKLADVIEEVAVRVGTRPVDNVYLTPHTDIAVFERGSFARQLRGQTERCLVLGAGVLEGMKLGPFKAILAHEYGHFSNRDTAGGGFALAVRRSLVLTALGLAHHGAAGWYNPAWIFILTFHKIFMRISQGASRLQEIMADRWAAFSYGPENFAKGLKHVIRRSIEFDVHVQTTIHEVVEHERPLANLYRYKPELKVEKKELDEAFDEALNKEPSPYDSHPKPADRIAWVRELATSAAVRPDDDMEVWDLFEGREALERSMTAAVLVSHGVAIAATEKAAAE